MAAIIDSVISATETIKDVRALDGGHLTSGASTRTAGASLIQLAGPSAESTKLLSISLHKVCGIVHAFNI